MVANAGAKEAVNPICGHQGVIGMSPGTRGVRCPWAAGNVGEKQQKASTVLQEGVCFWRVECLRVCRLALRDIPRDQGRDT